MVVMDPQQASSNKDDGPVGGTAYNFIWNPFQMWRVRVIKFPTERCETLDESQHFAGMSHTIHLEWNNRWQRMLWVDSFMVAT